MRLIRVITAAFVLSGLCVQVRAATVTIDGAKEYQTIDGFGAHGALNVWWGGGPFYNDQFLEDILVDLGMTIFRNEYYPTDGMGYDASQWQKQLPYLRAVKQKADSKGIDVRFFATLWSPPGGMKYNNSTKGTDALWNRVSNGLGPRNDFQNPNVDSEKGAKDNMYPALVNYCCEAVERYKNDVGEELAYFSVANEPRFAQSFNSCVWSPGQYRDIISMLGPKFQEKGYKTKLLGAEDMAARTYQYVKAVFEDDVSHAGDYMGVWAVHGYSNGVDPYLPNSVSKSLANVGRTYGVPVWMTETSGYTNDWGGEGAFMLGVTIASALYHGNFSGWVWWQLSESKNDQFQLMPNNGQKDKKYYVSKNFYRYVRPGAVRVESSSDDQDVLGVAFNHKQKKTLTVVLVNNNSGSKSVSLSGSNMPDNFTAYRTSASDNCKNVGSVSKSSISLPGKSVTTLVANNYVQDGSSATGVRPTNRLETGPRLDPHSIEQVRVFAADGRQVAVFEPDVSSLRPGIHWDGRDMSGRRVARGTYYSVLIDNAGNRHSGPSFVRGR